MCGKFTQMASWSQVVEYANLFGATVNDSERLFTPMRAVPVVHLNDGQPPRLASPMVWGFTDRKREGFRIPKHMHARGETVDRLPTFAEAFRYRRGITFAKTFNEGKEFDVLYDDGTPNGKTWTQQWVIKPKDDKPIIIAVIYDTFHVGRGDEYEFVQVTTPANAVIAPVTDRMPLLLREEDIPLWLGETDAPIEDVKALIQTYEFDPTEWDISIEDPTKKPPKPRKPKSKTPQPDLF